MAVIGRTRSGKSTLIEKLLESRRYSLVIQTKKDQMGWAGHVRIRRAEEIAGPKGWTMDGAKFVLRPDYGNRGKQADEIARALERVWKMGGWTITIDETYYVCDTLGLEHLVERLLTQGAGNNITVVCGMQRPVRVTRFAISESTHVLSFFLEGRDRKTLAEAGSPVIADVGAELRKFEFAWYYANERASDDVSRMIYVGTLDDLEEKPAELVSA